MVADARAPTVFTYNFQPIRNRVETEQPATRSLDVALQPYLSLSFQRFRSSRLCDCLFCLFYKKPATITESQAENLSTLKHIYRRINFKLNDATEYSSRSYRQLESKKQRIAKESICLDSSCFLPNCFNFQPKRLALDTIVKRNFDVTLL